MYFRKTRQQSGAQPSIPNSTNILTLFRDWAMRAILPTAKKNKRLKILPILLRINCACLLNIFLPFLKVSADIPCRNLYSKLSFVRASHCLKIRRKIFRRFQMPSASPMLLISVRSLRSRLGFHRSNIGRIFKRLFFFD